MIRPLPAGFTLIEVLLSVAIISLLTGVSLPVYETFVRRNDLDITSQNVALALRRAAGYARSMNYDDMWGVRVQASNVILFRGTTFASRLTAFDETIPIPSSITPGGLTEIQFSELSGAPNTTGSITLTSTTNDIRTVTINAKGTVTY